MPRLVFESDMARPHKETKVVYKNLPKHWGFAHIGVNKVDINKDLRTYRHLLYLIHEKTHLMFPDWSETKVRKVSSQWARFLWQNNFRWVDI